MEKQTEKAIRILLYTIISIMVLSVTIRLLFPVFVGAIFVKLGEAINSEKVKVERRINIENEIKKKEIVTADESRRNEAIAKKNEVILAKPRKFDGTIFSWRDEKGNKIFSNKGFPKDGKYTDGKIEIQ